jgi:predicted  nucleic acid-binding Zn-ribbon protein
MGVVAGNIGTDMSGPSTITTGRDVFIENETETIKNRIGKINERINELKTQKNDIETEYKKFQQEATNLAHYQDRAQVEQRDTISQENKLTECFDRIDELEAEIEKIDKSINQLAEQKEAQAEERKNLAEWSKANPGKAAIKVLQTLQAETRVCGKHSEKRVDEKARNVTIKELAYTESSGAEPTYEMKIVPNR